MLLSSSLTHASNISGCRTVWAMTYTQQIAITINTKFHLDVIANNIHSYCIILVVVIYIQIDILYNTSIVVSYIRRNTLAQKLLMASGGKPLLLRAVSVNSRGSSQSLTMP